MLRNWTAAPPPMLPIAAVSRSTIRRNKGQIHADPDHAAVTWVSVRAVPCCTEGAVPRSLPGLGLPAFVQRFQSPANRLPRLGVQGTELAGRIQLQARAQLQPEANGLVVPQGSSRNGP